jgi:hypothetical protein
MISEMTTETTRGVDKAIVIAVPVVSLVEKSKNVDILHFFLVRNGNSYIITFAFLKGFV